jgi:hypothetical protein
VLQLQQHCIELGRATWPDKVKITESVVEIPFDIRVRLDQELGVYVSMTTGKRWLPRQAKAAQVSACVLAHSAGAGHCGAAETQDRVAAYYDLINRHSVVHKFVAGCLHCICTRNTRLVVSASSASFAVAGAPSALARLSTERQLSQANGVMTASST